MKMKKITILASALLLGSTLIIFCSWEIRVC